MEFSSILFLFVFFPIFLITYFIIKKRTYRNVVLLLFSLLFYAWGEPFYIFLMISSIIINYFLAVLIDKNRKHSKLYLIIDVVFNIGMLLIFKYTDFFISGVNVVISKRIPLRNIALPIGISFYTFQTLSYVIDVYKKNVKVQRNILALGCYITAFPQLIAGPIVKYSTIEKELSNRHENINDIGSGIRLFVRGLSKKVLIANSVAYVTDTILLYNPSNYGFLGALLAMIAYTLQIYFDFSGYSDMAIGMGRMLGFHFNKNFDYPYISKTITEFWRRWHISLSSWFRDYVYIPLGGNRVSKKRLVFNILIVWMLTGLWHGASINFVIWGLFYGIILLIEKLFLKKYIEKLPVFFQHFYVIFIVIIGWTIFRNESIIELKNIFSSLIGLNGFGDLKLLTFSQVITFKNVFSIVLGIIFSTPILNSINIKMNKNKKYNFIKDILIILLFILCISSLVSGSYNPFIYFRF